MKEIVFVCSGNVFRSAAAEYLLTRALVDANITDYHVSSAGTIAKVREIHPLVNQALAKYSIDASRHVSRLLEDTIADEAHLLVAMSTNHQEHIWSDYSIEAPLFNEIAYGKKEPIYDFGENRACFEVKGLHYFDYVFDYLHAAMPSFIENMPRFLK